MEARRINLADPDFEPTDEELVALSRRAFADVEQQHQVALRRLVAAIEARRTEVRRHVAELLKLPAQP